MTASRTALTYDTSLDTGRGLVTPIEQRGEVAIDTLRHNADLDLIERFNGSGWSDSGCPKSRTAEWRSLLELRDTMQETRERGFDVAREQQFRLGRRIRQLLAERGFPSVAAEGFEAPGVVVSHTTDDGVHNGSKFVEQGLQIAAGVPLMCDEPDSFKTFRLGLFGLDKLSDTEGTVERLEHALNAMGYGKR